MKVIIGAGGSSQPGWISFNQEDLDVRSVGEWARYFSPESIDCIDAEHVWEHLTKDEGFIAALNCWLYLKPGGNLRLAVPDGFHPSFNYFNWVKPGNWLNGDDHKTLYTYNSLAGMLEKANFQCTLKEYFDEAGELHVDPMDYGRGYIRRSGFSLWAGILSPIVGTWFTSLIIDARKSADEDGIRHHNLKRAHFRRFDIDLTVSGI